MTESTPVFGVREPGQAYTRRPSAYAIVRDGGVAIAVVRTPRGHFLPGGGIDDGESAAQAATREAREEAGLVLGDARAIGDAEEFMRSDEEQAWFRKVCTFFVADVVGRTAATEHDHALVWLEPASALAVLTPETHRWAVQRATPAASTPAASTPAASTTERGA